MVRTWKKELSESDQRSRPRFAHSIHRISSACVRRPKGCVGDFDRRSRRQGNKPRLDAKSEEHGAHNHRVSHADVPFNRRTKQNKSDDPENDQDDAFPCKTLSYGTLHSFEPMRFAGTWKMYSNNARPPADQDDDTKGWFLNFKWPYQARFMNAFENVSGITRPRSSLLKLFYTTRVRTANRGIGIITMRAASDIDLAKCCLLFCLSREGFYE